MNAILEALGNIAAFVAVLFGRLGLLLAIPLTLAVVTALVLGVVALARALRRRALGLEQVAGVWWRADAAYAAGHTWARQAGEKLVVGLDDLARRLLPPEAKLVLAAPGTKLEKGDAMAWVEARGTKTALRSPAAGTVREAHREIESDAAPLRRDPYAKGWLLALEPAGSNGLLKGAAAREWLEKESHRLTHFLEKELGTATADGGQLVGPVPSLLNDDQWTRAAKEFLDPQ